ncbi:DUF4229 domain-containing protein [Streptomyces sp. ADMS]|uniref:DUF4229 domain-containing protein n=1 Tax=Streptomyces sp. ADMS TaxID=3071415 RepID=UPI00296EEB5E|nr:DUF4229 domain-containing protein [Streptomyces sp. ADMS]MDW4908745.1 DUF4229 domain-containing protein [Streptomyces sp. ADMS]
MLRYTLMRLGILVGCLLVVWGLVYSGIAPRGLGSSNGMWVILLSLVISAPISFVVLRKERDRASIQIVEKVDRVKANLDANRSQEDEAVDEAARAHEGQAQAEGRTQADGQAQAEGQARPQAQTQGQPS